MQFHKNIYHANAFTTLYRNHSFKKLQSWKNRNKINLKIINSIALFTKQRRLVSVRPKSIYQNSILEKLRHPGLTDITPQQPPVDYFPMEWFPSKLDFLPSAMWLRREEKRSKSHQAQTIVAYSINFTEFRLDFHLVHGVPTVLQGNETFFENFSASAAISTRIKHLFMHRFCVCTHETCSQSRVLLKIFNFENLMALGSFVKSKSNLRRAPRYFHRSVAPTSSKRNFV